MRRSAAFVIFFLLIAAPSAAGADPTELWHVDINSQSYGSAMVDDIDCDGSLEILIGTYYNDARVLVFNVQDGSIQLQVPAGQGQPVDNSITTADVDGDGEVEILWGNSGTTVFHIMDTNGVDEWTYTTGEVLDAPEALVDLTGDGIPEIVLASCGDQTTGEGLRALDAVHRQVVWTAEVPGCYQSAPLIFDCNGDSVPDAVVSTWFDAKVRCFSGVNGDRLWEFDTNDWMYHAGSFGDLDGDQVPEVAVGDYSGTLFVIHGHNGTEYWQADLNEVYIFGPTAMADLNNDGNLQVIVAGARIHTFAADGTPGWQSPNLNYVTRGPVVADADGNQTPDVIVATDEPNVRAFDGANGSPLWTYPLPGTCEVDHAPVVWDFDRDGYLDIFVVCGRGYSDPDPENNWGLALALRGEGRGQGWPSFSHDVHHSGNFEYPPGNRPNDPAWNPPEGCEGPDGGTQPDGSAGQDGGPTQDAAETQDASPDDQGPGPGGCRCNAGRSSAPSGPALVAVLLLAGLLWRRKKHGPR